MQSNVPDRLEAAPLSAAERAVERSLAARRRSAEESIERLVDAAFEIIRTTGTLEPTVQSIVTAAGLSNQAFYKHFRSKHELLVAVLDSGIERLAASLERRMAKAADPRGAVRAWMRGMLLQAIDPAAAEATRPFALARGRLADSFPAEVAASEERLTAPLRAAIAEARGDAADPQRDAADAEALYHVAMGWMQARLLENARPSKASAAQVEAFALAGLGLAPEPGDADGA